MRHFTISAQISFPPDGEEVHRAVFDSRTMLWTFDHGLEAIPVAPRGKSRLSLEALATWTLDERFPGIQWDFC